MSSTVHLGNPSDDKGPKILAVLWGLTGFTMVIVAARMFIRGKMLRNFGPDDWLIAFSMMMGIVYCAITTANIAIGYGKHAYVLDTSTVEEATFLNTLSFLFGIVSFSVPKLAVAAMLNRILNPSLVQKAAIWGLTGLGAVISGICIIILFTMCDPAHALWHTTLVAEGKATCRDTWILINYAIFTGAYSAFIDLYLAIYPAFVLMKLHMSLRKRMALCAALGLGAIASAMAVVKCTQVKGLADKNDYTYGTADLVLWTNVESDVVIIASCIPTLQPVLELILGKRKLSSYSGSKNKYKGSQQLHDYSHSRSQSKMNKSARKTDLTITGVESQESILRDEGGGHPMGAIRRTDNVVVEYGARGEGLGHSVESPGRESW
ncbi:uncharacterized protein DSM5745_09851 [Aspergillus mulundensis]|uniref:Rhodopsin domain-containing protein n=1 Tax=Aspergillus mulundensis TaxID=1810919 RepID=A0A3D8QS15_9EURO|nr:Uncharacterized protein DSM5745_09851 [Aspergillus mulundensis]RDW64440.1 Uncharacterized protein DSM5745_09851 [Aspergillus mulundensis]